jgi:hypothetical protein
MQPRTGCSSVRRTRARFMNRSRRPGTGAVHPLTFSQEAYQAGQLGAQTDDPSSSSRDAFLDRYAARDPMEMIREPSNDAG